MRSVEAKRRYCQLSCYCMQHIAQALTYNHPLRLPLLRIPSRLHSACRFQAAFTPRFPRATSTALLQVCNPTMPRLILRALAVFMLPDAHSWRGLLPPLSCLPCTAAVDAFQRAALCGTLRVLGHHCRKRTCSKRPQEPLSLCEAASMLPASCCCAHTHIATFHP